MNNFDQLKELFKEFPGIGPRQAERFVYFILRKNNGYATDLARAITNLKKHMHQCAESFQFFYSENPKETLSPIARNLHRDQSLLMIVEKDTDLENIERTGAYAGKYFVLGGTVPLLEKEPHKKIRLDPLKKLLEEKGRLGVLQEVIFALSANPDGEYTAEKTKEYIAPVIEKYALKQSELGRGLSTGTELEYSDKETIKNALRYRHQ